jgi:hypothetical protein
MLERPQIAGDSEYLCMRRRIRDSATQADQSWDMDSGK